MEKVFGLFQPFALPIEIYFSNQSMTLDMWISITFEGNFLPAD